MFNNSGLSLNQAPPIKVVLRFFITASIFGVVAGIFIATFGKNIENFASSEALIVTHILTLGVMASFMLGALFQMLPVLCGVAIKAPVDISLRINYSLIVGTIFLLLAFYNDSLINYTFAALFLSISLISSTYIMLKDLLKIEHSVSSKGMTIALFSLLFLTTLGLALLYIRSGHYLSIEYLKLKELHFSFGLFGWISLLIISVSFQVIEMFYVTKPYNKVYAKYAPIAIFALLVLSFFSKIFLYIAILIIATHMVLTIINLKNKKRPINDATIYFWYLGLSNFLIFTLALFLSIFIELPTILIAAFFSFFALSIVFAMVYKIVPFLSWFHLNAQGYFDAPMMHEFISPKYAKVNFYLFILSEVLLLISIKFSLFYSFAGVLISAVFLMLFSAIYSSIQKYKHTLKHGTKLNLNMNM